VPMETGDKTVVEEIADRLGTGDDRAFADVDLLYGYLWTREEGRWRLYRAIDSPDYIEGSNEDMGAMRPVLTATGDTLVWVRMGAELRRFLSGEQETVSGKKPSTEWHGTGWTG
jgi:hypothetical protein